MAARGLVAAPGPSGVTCLVPPVSCRAAQIDRFRLHRSGANLSSVTCDVSSRNPGILPSAPYVGSRLTLLPLSDYVYGRPMSSVIPANICSSDGPSTVKKKDIRSTNCVKQEKLMPKDIKWSVSPFFAIFFIFYFVYICFHLADWFIREQKRRDRWRKGRTTQKLI